MEKEELYDMCSNILDLHRQRFIILSKIAKSNYRNNITVKGGVVMFNITNDKR